MLLEFLQSLLLVVTSLLLWPIIILITVVNEGVRSFVSFLLLPTGVHLLQNGMDNMMWSTQLSTKTVVVALYSRNVGLDLSKEISSFKTAFAKKGENGSTLYSKLTRILTIRCGYGCTLENDHFQIENHVKLFRTLGMEEVPEAEFVGTILPDLMRTMEESKPQWEWILFPKLRRQSGDLNSLRIFRYDHGYMDGASVGLFLAENLFDGEKPPEFFINPRKSRGSRLLQFLAQSWARFNLPFILLYGGVAGWLNNKDKPFGATGYSGKQYFAGPEIMDLNLIKSAARVENRNVASILLSRYGPALFQVLSPSQQNSLGESPITVSLMGAVIPYKGLKPRNQYTTVSKTIPLGYRRDNRLPNLGPDFEYYFVHTYLAWLGRLPIPLIQAFVSVDEATFSLNNIPFLRGKGAINGSVIEEITGWGMLCVPVGLDVVGTSYGDTLSLSAHSVEGCLTAEQLQDFLQNYKTELATFAKPCVEFNSAHSSRSAA